MANSRWPETVSAAEVQSEKALRDDLAPEPEYLYRDDSAYGQLALEVANGGLDDSEESDLPALDGWLSDM